MRNVWTIARRELYTLFGSPIAYVAMAAFLAMLGLLLWLSVVYSQVATMSQVLGNGWAFFITILFTAVVTMRLLAEEQRSGTIEVVLTAPVRDWELIVGKYLASLILFLAVLVVSLYQPIVLTRLGEPDVGTLISSYVGFFLVGAALLAIGTMTSTFTRSQLVSAIVAASIGVALWLLEFVARQWLGTFVGNLIFRLAFFVHYDDFVRGVIDTRHVVYYLSVVAFSLFLATRILEARKWR